MKLDKYLKENQSKRVSDYNWKKMSKGTQKTILQLEFCIERNAPNLNKILNNLLEEVFQDGFEEGFDNGYEQAQDNYGDGPSN